MPSTINAQMLPPGFYAFEGDAGRLPAQIADFSRAYLLAKAGDGDYATPIQITSLNDAVDRFAVSGVESAAIDTVFKHNPRSVLFLVRVPIGQVEQVGVLTADDQAEYTVTVDAITSTYQAVTNDTASEIIAGLVAAVNDNTDINTQVIAEGIDGDNDTFNLRILDPTAATLTISVSASGTGDLSLTDLTGSEPTEKDFVYALDNAFDNELHRPGFLFAPGAFHTLDPEDRHALGAAMSNFATEYDWFALADPGPELATVEDYRADGLEYSSERGHCAYYAPYMETTSEQALPPSPYVVGVALSRYEREGFYQPPAGPKYQLRNLRSISLQIGEADHAVLNNDHNINVIKRIQGGGYQIRGARTRTTNVFFTSITDRVIFNVILESLRITYRDKVFESIGRAEEFFRSIRRTGITLLNRFWEAGALFGATPANAFEVICDRSNNSDTDLEASVANITIYAVPSPTIEKLIANVNRVAIGEIQFFTGNVQNAQTAEE